MSIEDRITRPSGMTGDQVSEALDSIREDARHGDRDAQRYLADLSYRAQRAGGRR